MKRTHRLSFPTRLKNSFNDRHSSQTPSPSSTRMTARTRLLRLLLGDHWRRVSVSHSRRRPLHRNRLSRRAYPVTRHRRSPWRRAPATAHSRRLPELEKSLLIYSGFRRAISVQGRNHPEALPAAISFRLASEWHLRPRRRRSPRLPEVSKRTPPSDGQRSTRSVRVMRVCCGTLRQSC